MSDRECYVNCNQDYTGTLEPAPLDDPARFKTLARSEAEG